jgi:superfamily I DNA and RNA helicase
VVNRHTEKEWSLKKITLKEENLLELDIIVIILDQDGNQDIGLAEVGKLI